MNAYELADELNEYNKDGLPVLVVDKAEKMLRQQAKRIEELEKRPAINKEDGLVCAKCYGSFKQKPLSDDEIDEILDSLIDEDEGCSYYDFAKAIEERHGIK